MTPAVVFDVYDHRGRWVWSCFTSMNEAWRFACYAQHHMIRGRVQARVVL